MAGLVTLFIGFAKYFYGIAEQVAFWFERNTRFFDRGQKVFWVAPALLAAVGLGQYLSTNGKSRKLCRRICKRLAE